ncbi:hypothetical protein HYV79_00605 [Candidatus Woesearchaeota archaeon]|nr:hypothetical protein [Candidatus Woesearchaeota archaeon]
MNHIIPPDNLDELARKFGFGKYASLPKDNVNSTTTKPVTKTSNTGNFVIEVLADRYRLHNIMYRGELYVVDWSKDFLRGGEQHSQQEWIDLTKNEEFTLPDSPLCFASMQTLFKNKEETNLIEQVRNYFAQTFKVEGNINRPHTSSRAIYNPRGNDEVIHRLGYPDQYTVSTKLIGQDGYITTIKPENEMNTLLATQNCEEIQQVIEWISGKKPYLYRINNKPSSKEERAVVLGVDSSNYFDIADGDIDGGRPARGVVVARENSS